MKIRADYGSILAAAERAHVALKDVEVRGRDWQITLAPVGDAYRRTGQSQTTTGKHRRINAVCYHGHFAFFRALYRLAPDAVIRTSMATYRSAEELERDAYLAAERNVGSEYYPRRYADLCTCHEYKNGGRLPTWQSDGTATYL